MQYTESVVDCLKGIAKEHPEPIDWQSVCEQVKDPRRKQGQRFSMTSILLLALAAMLSNHLSELAIAQWGAGQSDEIKKALGFENGVTPHQTTIQRLFRRLNVEEVESVNACVILGSRHFSPPESPLSMFLKGEKTGIRASACGKMSQGERK